MATEKRLIDVASAWKTAQKIFTDTVLLFAIKRTLDETPTVDAVEVVHGRWIGGYSGTEYTIPKCSRCGYGNGAVGASNYCPNCGAKMDGERKDNEQT